MALLPVEDARARIVKKVAALPAEAVVLAEARGRVLARPVKAIRNQPPFDSSAMDGYAVVAADLAATPVSLKVIGVSAAGHRYRGAVRSGEAVRIFTGAPVPKGADAVVIQENVALQAEPYISVQQPVAAGQNIRGAGIDFQRGEILLPAGTRLNARDIQLAAAANADVVQVRRRPRAMIFGTGDELVAPGGQPAADQIVSSNGHALTAMAEMFGADVIHLGIVPDKLKATQRAIARAEGADVLVTTGGASVGDHDYVREALVSSGVKIDFWKIAMRPGKPCMYGRKNGMHVLGLPGNPVSALVCARLFLKPLLDALQGLPVTDELEDAVAGAPMKENDTRQDYVRAVLAPGGGGCLVATPFGRQDSSMQRSFRESQALIVRPPHAPAVQEGDLIKILRLDF